MKENGLNVFEKNLVSDPMVEIGRFKEGRKGKGVEYYRCINKKVEVIYSDGTQREALYVHLMKRNIEIKQNINEDDYYIIAPGIVSSDSKDIKKYRTKEIKHMYRYFSKTLKNKIKRSLSNNRI